MSWLFRKATGAPSPKAVAATTINSLEGLSVAALSRSPGAADAAMKAAVLPAPATSPDKTPAQEPATAAPPHHMRRSTVNGDRLVSGSIQPNGPLEALLPPPAFLRGSMLRLFCLKQRAQNLVSALVLGPGGLQQRFGFQAGATGGAACSVAALVSDLCHAPGPTPSLGAAVAALHERIFENYNRWARMLGPPAAPVYSVESGEAGEDRAALLADQRRVTSALERLSRNCGLAPQQAGVGVSVGVDGCGGGCAGAFVCCCVAPSTPSESLGARKSPAVVAAVSTAPTASTPAPTASLSPAASSVCDSTGGSDSGPALSEDHSASQSQSLDSQSASGGEVLSVIGGSASSSSSSRQFTFPAKAASGPSASSLEPRPRVRSTAPGSDTATRLAELSLFYCVRTEAANLRFMPELLCWLFHQMRHGVRPPAAEDVQAEAARDAAGAGGAANPESSFFARTTVAPLYAHLKRASVPTRDVPPPWCLESALCCCCRKLGRHRPVKNSARPNYDDFNEFFWRADCLRFTWHSLDAAAGAAQLPPVAKTFREKASYAAVALSFWRLLAFLVVLFHALLVVSADIVAAGGVNLTGIALLDPGQTAIDLTACFVTLSVMHIVHALLACCHGMPLGDHRFVEGLTPLLHGTNLIKGLWAVGWVAVICLLYLSGPLTGVDLFGGPLWLAVVAARGCCMLLNEGVLSPCGCSRAHRVRRFVMSVERVYASSPQGAGDTVLGWKWMRQPVARVLKYSAFWALLLAGKVALDLQILTQQANLVATAAATPLVYAWSGYTLPGIPHPILFFGSWLTIGCLYALDSYIVFVLGAAALGWWALRCDGVGKVRHNGDVRTAFARGLGGGGGACCGLLGGGPAPLARQFVDKMLPLARARGVAADAVFRRPWDQFVMSLREQDLLSNDEQCRLMYGDRVLGVAAQQPLFLYAGRLRGLIRRASQLAQAAFTCPTDADWLAAALPDAATEEAAAEVLRGLPLLLEAVCRSHSAVGPRDPHVGETLRALFAPRPGESLREAVGLLLTGSGGGGAGGAAAHTEGGGGGHQHSSSGGGHSGRPRNADPVSVLRGLAGQVATLCVEFERAGASTRLRGSPLLHTTCELLLRLHALWHPHQRRTDEDEAAAAHEATRIPVAAAGHHRGGVAVGDAAAGGSAHPSSFAGPMLERLASIANSSSLRGLSLDGVSEEEADCSEDDDTAVAVAISVSTAAAAPSPAAHPSTASCASRQQQQQLHHDTRTVPGLVRLLRLPNEGSGRLDGAGDGGGGESAGAAADRYESLCEVARRVYYLLTMAHTDGSLAVPEAERRLSFFIGSLYMEALPASPSPLEVPSFAVLTPHYAEAVVYEKRGFLTAANAHGVSPMVYLKSLHAPEWRNFCERLGVRNETEAWHAARDAQGTYVSGEMEVRLWASHRGQTLSRTVHGVMEHARALRLLATLQLELEYAALDEAAEAGVRTLYDGDAAAVAAGARQQQVLQDAAAASSPGGEGEGAASRTPDSSAPPGSVAGAGVGLFGSFMQPAAAGTPPPTDAAAAGPGAAAAPTLQSAAAASRAAAAAAASRQADLERDAALAAQWFTAERFQYVLCAQRYAEHGEEDVRRRVELDYLMLTHPLLSVAYFDGGVSQHTARRRLMSVVRNGAGTRYALPLPGNAIADGIGEGKPENQNNGAAYVFAHALQTLDMNQDAYFEECLKLPNAMREMFTPSADSGKPVVVAGMREHIFTHCLSASAFFMSQQEYLFGTMWQRIMASPLKVRFHYGHPDVWDNTFVKTRGGTAKASASVNVSEDIFGGYAAVLRGGESVHLEYMQVGKGRDVGVLQIETFESKISGGTAISMTSRDAYRVFEGMDLARLFSYYHSCGGFYISNILVVLSYISTLYYMCAMALTGLDLAVLASNRLYLLGTVNALQWFVQLGLLSVVPLAVLYALEVGPVQALWRTVAMTLTFSPVFFMLEIQTKAYFFDAALCFGRQAYLATGRDFVLRHVPFDEGYRATAVSHIYLGAEATLLLLLTSAFGSFQSLTAYMFFFVSGWLFTASLLFGAAWFNPFALQWRAVSADAAAWWAWMTREDHGAGASGGPGPEAAWSVWYERELGGQYAHANVLARAWRLLRLSRLLLLAALLVWRLPLAAGGQQPLYLAMYVGLGLATVLGLQAAHWLTTACCSSSSALSTAAGLVQCTLMRTVYTAAVGAAIYLGLQSDGGLSALGFVTAVLAYHVCLWWVSRALNIVSCAPLAAGTRGVHKIFDFELGAALLGVQLAFAAMLPMGGALHSHMLFSSQYAQAAEAIAGTSEALGRLAHGSGGGAGAAAARFLKLKTLGEGVGHRGGAVTGAVGSTSAAAAAGAAAVAAAQPRNRWGLPKRRNEPPPPLALPLPPAFGGGGGDGVAAEAAVSAAEASRGPDNRIGVRRFRLRALDDIDRGAAAATTAAAAAAAASKGGVVASSSAAEPPSFPAGFGTVAIAGLAAEPSPPSSPPSASTHGYDGQSAAEQQPSAAAAPVVPRKTLAELMAVFAAAAAAAAAATAPPLAGAAAASEEEAKGAGVTSSLKSLGRASGGMRPRGGGVNGPPSPEDSEDAAGGRRGAGGAQAALTGVAAMRARFELQRKKADRAPGAKKGSGAARRR